MFTTESGIVGIDLDKCLDEHGHPNETATAILARIPPTYTEVSPSGTGLHIFLKGTLPTGGNRKGTVEMYSAGRYFTMTGNRYNNCADIIADDNGVIAWIHETYIKMQSSRKQKYNQSNSDFIVGLSDDELLEMARNAKDGTAFTALWDGQWQGKYKSQSEADFALCCKLVFWSKNSIVQVDRLFRQSGLMRDKWNTEYGHRTITNACQVTTEVYTPPKPKNQNIAVQYGCYYRVKGKNTSQLTNYESAGKKH